MSNSEKLRLLMRDILLLGDDEYRCDLKRTEVETWDSLSVVAIAVGVEETFGHHMTESEAVAINGVADIISFLKSKDVSFEE